MDSRFFSSRIDVLILASLRTEAQVVHKKSDQSANHGNVAEPLQWPFPQFHRPRDVRISRQAAINLRLGRVMQHVNYATKPEIDRKSTRLNSSHSQISYAVFCLNKKNSVHCLT